MAARKSSAVAAESAAPSDEGILGGAPGASEDREETTDSGSPVTPAEATGEDGPEGAADSPQPPETAVASDSGDSGPAVTISDPRPRCGVEGECTPEYLAWLSRNDPEEHKAACVRCRIPVTE